MTQIELTGDDPLQNGTWRFADPKLDSEALSWVVPVCAVLFTDTIRFCYDSFFIGHNFDTAAAAVDYAFPILQNGSCGNTRRIILQEAHPAINNTRINGRTI